MLLGAVNPPASRPHDYFSMKLKKNIATSEAGFIFNPATGDSYAANPLTVDILARAKEGLDVPAIKADILERYDVLPAQLEKDWDDLVTQLQDFNLLD
jgi:hypothetical protein